jgi:dihydrofolate reductase
VAAAYTFDVFSTLDGFGSPGGGDWGAYWGKQGPEFLAHRLASFAQEQRMVFGGETYRLFALFRPSLDAGPEAGDPWVTRMLSMPTTVVSNTLQEPLAFPSGTVARGEPADIVARLKTESRVPLRSHGSLSLNRQLLAAGLVDRIQVTIFPVLTAGTGGEPIFQGAGDFDLELIDARTLDGNTQELVYRPALHG